MISEFWIISTARFRLPSGSTSWNSFCNRVVVGVSLHQQNGWQCQGSLKQVVADRLANLLLGPLKVQDIVDNLERHTQVVAVGLQRLHQALRAAAEDGSRLGGRGE